MRQMRNAPWDMSSLDDYPTENIQPVMLPEDARGNTELPVTAERVRKGLFNWNKELIDRTRTTGNEHAYLVDYYGNVLGVIEGGQEDVTFQKDFQKNRVLATHTHPSFQIVPSQEDLSMLIDGIDTPGTTSIITVAEGYEQDHYPIMTIAKVNEMGLNQSQTTFEILFERALDNGIEVMNFETDTRVMADKDFIKSEQLLIIEDLASRLADESKKMGANFKITIDTIPA